MTDTGQRAMSARQVAKQVTGAMALVLLLALQGCASNPNAVTRDPWEPFNRSVSKFNEGIDAVVLKPVATVYRDVTPALVRTGVSNFFGNLGDLWSAINSALQLKGRNALENLFRFNINTFLGLGGILDIASELDLERHKEDFGQTLGRWGVPTGPYVVLPILGPSTLRDALSLTFDRQGNPITYVDNNSTRYFLYGMKAVDARANLLRTGSVLDQAALDKYTFTRDVFLQYRRAEISDGNPSDGKVQGSGLAGAGIDGADPVAEPAANPAATPASSQAPAPAKK
ncbi:MAG: VacJ family lipoprotein [Bdellovibrionales bacterium]|nr:VacJ family lipoprotein [Ramlibacter sp.]